MGSFLDPALMQIKMLVTHDVDVELVFAPPDVNRIGQPPLTARGESGFFRRVQFYIRLSLVVNRRVAPCWNSVASRLSLSALQIIF
jgi:hypothetical protein